MKVVLDDGEVVGFLVRDFLIVYRKRDIFKLVIIEVEVKFKLNKNV